MPWVCLITPIVVYIPLTLSSDLQSEACEFARERLFPRAPTPVTYHAGNRRLTTLGPRAFPPKSQSILYHPSCLRVTLHSYFEIGRIYQQDILPESTVFIHSITTLVLEQYFLHHVYFLLSIGVHRSRYHNQILSVPRLYPKQLREILISFCCYLELTSRLVVQTQDCEFHTNCDIQSRIKSSQNDSISHVNTKSN